MTLTPQETSFFRSIKRTAAALLLIYRLNRPVLITEISLILDIDRKTAANQLKSLASLQVITHTRAGWIITQGGTQLILPAAQPELMGKNSPSAYSMGKNSPLNTSSSTCNLESFLFEEEEEEVESELTRNILASLAQYGIGPTPNVLKIIRLPHITQEYITYQAERLRKENKFSTGLLLTILRYADPMPASDEDRRRKHFEEINERTDRIVEERKKSETARR